MSEEPEQTAAMSPAPAVRRSWRQFGVPLAAVAIVLALLVLGLAYYQATPRCHEQARRLIVAQIAEATGGRVELRAVDWQVWRLRLNLHGLVIHGSEAADRRPLLQLDEAQLHLKLLPLLRGRLMLHELQLQRPFAHLEVHSDGTTNLPTPRVKLRPGESMNELFRLAMDRAVLTDGELEYNDRRTPLDGEASGVVLAMSYGNAVYQGEARLGAIRVRWPGLAPVLLGGEVQFRLRRDAVDVSRLRLWQGRSWLEASGTLRDLAAPQLQFDYHASADGGELAHLLHYGELKSGVLETRGQGQYRARDGEYVLHGQAIARGVNWADDTLRLTQVNGGFNYTLDPRHLHAAPIFATALGGAAHGDLDIQLRGRTSGALRLAVVGVPLSEALAAFSRSDLPLARLKLGGAVGGQVAIDWRDGVDTARLHVALAVTPVRRGGALPVAANIAASVTLNDGFIDVQQATAQTDFSQVTARGRLARQFAVQLDVRSAAARELAPLVAQWRGEREQELPVEFFGGVEFHGQVGGTLHGVTLAGHLDLRDFATTLRRSRMPNRGNGQNPSGATTHDVRTRWDRLTGEVEYSATRESLHHGLLRRGAASLQLDASVALHNGRYDTQQPFAAHLKADKLAVDDLQSLFATQYPVSGEASGEIDVHGTAQHMQGGGQVTIRNGRAWQQAVREARADVQFTENQARLRNIVVHSDLMQLSGAAAFNVETEAFTFDLKGSEVKIENLDFVRAHKLGTRGVAAFEVHGEGTPQAPVLNGRIRVQALSIQGHSMGGLNVDAVTHGDRMTVAVRSNFRNATLTMDGTIELHDQMPMHLTGKAESREFAPWLETLLPLRAGLGQSAIQAQWEITGELKRPRDWTAQLNVQNWNLSYGGITVASDGPIQLQLAQQILHIKRFNMAGENGTRYLQVGGEVELGGARRLNLQARGSMNLKMLETFDSKLSASGVADLNLQVNGTMAQPDFHGRMSVRNAAVSYLEFSNGLSEITGTLTFNEDRLQVQQLTARSGGGLLHCGGYVSLAAGQGWNFNLTVNGSDIRLRYPEGLSSTADAKLTLIGSPQNAVLSGEVVIKRLGLNPQFDFASYLAQSKRGSVVAGVDSPLNALHLDVHVSSAPELEVQTALAHVSGNIDLRLRGTAARPSVLGRVNVLEGTIYFNGTKYRLERGDILFTNPVRIEPNLDVELSARVRDYDLTLGFHGPISRLTPSYRSDPPLSSNDIISLMALGKTVEESASQSTVGTAQYKPSVTTEDASTALLGQALNATVGNRVQRLFGVSRLKIDPNTGGALNAGLARVTIEQQVSNNVTLTYISNVNQSAQQIIEFEYNLGKGVSIVGERDQSGIVSFDVLFRVRRK